MLRAVQLRAAGQAVAPKLFVKQISTAFKYVPEQVIIRAASCNFGLACSKAALICIGLNVCCVVGAVNWFGILMDVNAMRIKLKYACALKPLHVPCVAHSC